MWLLRQSFCTWSTSSAYKLQNEDDRGWLENLRFKCFRAMASGKLSGALFSNYKLKGIDGLIKEIDEKNRKLLSKSNS